MALYKVTTSQGKLIKKIEEHYYKFLILPIFNYILLYRMMRKDGYQSKTSGEKGRDLKMTNSSLND